MDGLVDTNCRRSDGDGIAASVSEAEFIEAFSAPL